MLPTAVVDWPERLAERGFDLCEVFGSGDYNAAPEATGHAFRLPSFGRQSALGLMIATGKALWLPFVRALYESRALELSRHPLNEYTEAVVNELCHTSPVATAVFFAHSSDPVIPMQRIAHVARLAELAPCHLSVHRQHGPWLGLRAVVVFDLEAPPPPERPPARHCPSCHKPCLPVLERLLRRQQGEQVPPLAWLELRESCPVGPDARYSEDQIRYHYTKDRSALAWPPRASEKGLAE